MVIGVFGTMMFHIITRVGVNTVVVNVVKATTPVVVSNFEKLLIGVGGLGISALLGEAVCKQLDKDLGCIGLKFTEPVKELEKK